MAGDEIVKESNIYCITKIMDYKGSFEREKGHEQNINYEKN